LKLTLKNPLDCERFLIKVKSIRSQFNFFIELLKIPATIGNKTTTGSQSPHLSITRLEALRPDQPVFRQFFHSTISIFPAPNGWQTALHIVTAVHPRAMAPSPRAPTPNAPFIEGDSGLVQHHHPSA